MEERENGKHYMSARACSASRKDTFVPILITVFNWKIKYALCLHKQHFCGLLAMLAFEKVIGGYGMGGICEWRWGARCGVSGMHACARPGQRASSPAVSDVTVHLCVSGVWSKSITETKKPNATNHVHNSSLFPSSLLHFLTLSLSLSSPS